MRATKTALAVIALLSYGVFLAGEEKGPRSPRSVPTGLGPVEKAFPRKSSPAFPRLDRGLNRIVTSVDPFESAGELGYRVLDGRVQVVVVTDEGFSDEMERWLANRGARHVSIAGNLVQAFIPPNLLPKLGRHSRVTYIRKPSYVDKAPPPKIQADTKLLGSTSEGVQAMNADEWHGSGFLGQGVNMAVIDTGFKGFQSLTGTDLPSGSRVSYYVYPGANIDSTDHGTACAEIIFDIVPDVAKMKLYAVATDIDIANAIASAQSFGVDVISISLGKLTWSPGNGTGVIADAINTFTNSGGIVAVSAGNARLSHWQGSWNDTNGDGRLDFGHGYDTNFILKMDRSSFHWVPSYLLTLKPIIVRLIWNQWDSPDTNIDLHLVRWDGVNPFEVVKSSENLQTGLPGQQPTEEINYPTLLGGYFGVAITHHGGPTDIDLEIESRLALNPFEDSVPSGSVIAPGDTANAITVGALDAGYPYALEPYSSRGPTNGPGGSLAGGFVKPDIAGYANVSTRSSGGSFDGTSAACPHVAGAAALVWSGHPDWTNDEVRSYLESQAAEMGSAGKDNDFGHGRLLLGAPPGAGGCTYILSPSSATWGPSSASGSISVVAPAHCAWSAASGEPWLSITSGTNYTGNSVVSYNVAENAGPQRTGALYIAGTEFRVTQSAGSGGCNYDLVPSDANFGPGGGDGNFTVSTTSGCSWTATSDDSWITITSGATGTGSGSVSYHVSINNDSGRTGTITAAGRIFFVDQNTPCDSDGPPESSFKMSTDQAFVGETVVFTDTSSKAGVVDSKVIEAKSGNTAPTSWNWTITLADSVVATGSRQSFSYTFEALGKYEVKLVATNCAGSNSITRNLEVLIALPEDFVIPAAVSLSGDNNTQWETDFRFFNPCGADMEVRFFFEPENTNNSNGELSFRSFRLAPNETRTFGSLSEAIPALGGDRVSGSARVESQSASGCKVLLVSRTYNDTPEGSLGLFVPALQVKRMGQDFLDLAGLIQNSDYRANLRLVNYGDLDAWVPLSLIFSNGDRVGGRKAQVLGHSTKQINDIAEWLGVSDDLTPFSVRAEVKGRDVQAFATIIDNTTGDSVLSLSSFTEDNTVWLVGVANLAGVNDSQWRTDVCLYNPTDNSLAGELKFVVGGSPNEISGFGWPILDTHRMVYYPDILGGRFGLDGTKGYIVLTGASGGPAVQVAARTYNLDDAGGTYGLNLQPFTADDLLMAGDIQYIAGVSNSEDQSVGFRTNTGYLNTNETEVAAVRITMYGQNGVRAAEPFEFLVAPGAMKQFNVFKKLGLGDETMTGSIEIEVVSGGGIAAYATEIDNRTQDSIFIPAQRRMFGLPH